MSLKNTFTGLDYWRLADEVSVVDASFLTIGLDPGHYSLREPSSPLTSNIQKDAGYSDEDETYSDIDGLIWLAPAHFRAVFKAIRNAVLSNKLSAKVVNLGRKPDFTEGYGGGFPIEPEEHEDKRSYGFALTRGIPTVFSNADSILCYQGRQEDRVLYILKEPDWLQTTVQVEDLKRWFNSKGAAPAFFFPNGVADGFRDREHPRYSAKLATAVAAWETVHRPAKNKSAKQTLNDWVIGNGVRFDLGNEDGVVSPTVADEIAKVANWKTGGGANPTNVELEQADATLGVPIQNFQKVEEDEVRIPSRRDDLDDDIPF